MIRTQQDFLQAIQVLQACKVCSFDVHNHSYRDYIGYLCFIEISTLECNYVFDCLSLQNHIEQLKVIFEDQHILKIGLNSLLKLLWLQRDYNIFCKGLIDVNYIMNIYNQQPTIQYICEQLKQNYQSYVVQFDYSARPIQNEFLVLRFLSSGSFFLLRYFGYLFTQLSIQKIRDVIFGLIVNFSQQLCECKYFSHPYFIKELGDDFQRLSRVLNIKENSLQSYVLKKILKWRDIKARFSNESRQFILQEDAITEILLNCHQDMNKQSALKILQKFSHRYSPQFIEEVASQLEWFSEKYCLKLEKNLENQQLALITQNQILSQLYASNNQSIKQSSDKIVNITLNSSKNMFDMKTIIENLEKASNDEVKQQQGNREQLYKEIIGMTELLPETLSEDYLQGLFGDNQTSKTSQQGSVVQKISNKSQSEQTDTSIKNQERIMSELIRFINAKQKNQLVDIDKEMEKNIYQFENNFFLDNDRLMISQTEDSVPSTFEEVLTVIQQNQVKQQLNKSKTTGGNESTSKSLNNQLKENKLDKKYQNDSLQTKNNSLKSPVQGGKYSNVDIILKQIKWI